VVELRYEDIINYVEGLVGQGDELQAWVYRRSDELRDQGVISIDPTRGRFLELVARLRSPRRVLEVGSGAGYSALWFLKGMGKKGTLEAIEINSEVAERLEEVIEEAGLRRRVKVHVGPALSTLRRLQGPYDIVFVDADKDEYPRYLEYAMKLTKPGAVILADNMLWSGAAFLSGVRKEGASGIIEYTKRIFSDRRLSSLIVPLGDGLAISFRVK
jgi:predicted O-methyltransferase YrrM